MANPGYVRNSDGNDADNGSTWALANATFAGAFTDASAGDRIWFSDAHAETLSGNVTLACPGTAANPCQILCGDDAAEPPTAFATTGTITTSGNTFITTTGSFYWRGLLLSTVTGSVNTGLTLAPADGIQVFDTCEFALNNSGGTGTITAGQDTNSGAASYVKWVNCNCSFGSTGGRIQVGHGVFVWDGGSLNAGVGVPTTLFRSSSLDRGHTAIIRGVDLSQLASGRNLADAASMDRDSSFSFENCKLGASVSITTGSFPGPGPFVRAVNCDSADTNYRYAYREYYGEIDHETTIVRTGGASDGTTGFSRKYTSSANTKLITPLADDEGWFRFWNTTTGSAITVRMEMVNDGTTLETDEVGMEARYLGTSGFPLELRATTLPSVIASPSAHSASSETWTTTGLTSPVKQYMELTFTPQEVGWVYVRPVVALASKTVYFCPKLEVS